MKWSQSILAFITTCVCLGMNAERVAAADWTWIDATADHMPFDAVVGGSEGNGDRLYICRAGHQNGIYPGKFRPGFAGCNIGSDGNEVAVPNFQILVPTWAPASNGSIPREAPAFGHEADGSPLFICRANHQGGLHPGRVSPGLGGCHIGYGGQEIFVPNYEVLITQEHAVVPGLPDTEALVGGSEDGKNLYICLADHNGGTHPGKFRPGFDGCNIALGGAEVTEKFHWNLLIPTWVASDSGDPNPVLFQEGNEADGTPLYVCRSGLPLSANGSGEHPGRFRAGLGGCDVTWAGKEYVHSQYFRILAPVVFVRVP